MIKTLLLSVILAFSSLILFAQDASRFFSKADLMPMGIYYYPEHWNRSEWDRDIKRISELGFEFIHIAEFAWIDLEPEEGKYNFEWLDQVVDLAAKYKLKVIMGTPTAIMPVWMGIKYPEVFLMNASYQRAEHGTRAQESISNGDYRRLSVNIVKELGKRYGKNPNVWGWQLDNEPEAKADYSPAAQQAFHLWLLKKYSSIANLNQAWGTAFWSQTYSSFDQIKVANAALVGWWGSNPHAILDFKRFNADTQAAFLDFQAETLRPLISEKQFITTNYTGWSPQADPRRAEKLDFPTYTIYPNGGSANLGDKGFRLGDNRAMSFAPDFQRSFRGVTAVMELQPGQVNWGATNSLLLPGTVRMWLYHSFASGCSFACSYRFRQINYGAEQYHGAIMKSDGVTLSQGGKDYQKVMNEMEDLRKVYDPKAKYPAKLAARKTALLWNYDNLWSLEFPKQTVQWDTRQFFQKYMEIAKSFGAPTDVLYENDDLTDYKVVIAPAFELVDSALVQKWMNYVKQGGNLVLTIRTGVKNRWGHIFRSGWAGPVYPLIDATISDFDQLLPDMIGKVDYQSKTYNWNNWADLITSNKPENELAHYSDQFYAGKAAVVTNRIGKGTVTYIGVDTDDELLERDVMRKVYAQAGISTENYPEGIYVQWRDGFWVAVNYSSNDYELSLPESAKIILGENTLKPAGVTVWKD
jgi:beta-galactosidase